MLNLLFISDSPKIEYIKSVLQPVLKVIIDVVPDFDHGLKDVFEKRPATVCIQDQIAGITGESVARHIKMLLGTGAPTFILIHEGGNKAKQIKGLFDYVVDLGQSDAKLAEQIQSTLKIVVGDQWDKIYIPPAQTAPPVSPMSALSEDSRKDADKLVDDFLADLETTGFTAVEDTIPPPASKFAIPQVESFVTQTSEEILNDMQLEHDTQVRALKLAAEKAALEAIERDKAAREAAAPSAATVSTSGSAVLPELPTKLAAASAAGTTREPVPIDKKTIKSSVVVAGAPPAVTPPPQQPPVAAAEFRVNHDNSAVPEQIPEDLLLAFEENYRLESRSRKRVIAAGSALLLILCFGGWYYMKRHPDMLVALKIPTNKSAQTSPAPVSTSPAPSVAPAPVLQTPLKETADKSAANTALPVFIPAAGHDKSYAEKNPGWERYTDKRVEFRVFSAEGKVKAVQTLAVAGNVIPESMVKSVLVELTGSSDYKITSRESKSGFLVLKASAAQKADLLFYKKNSALRAFVISIN